MAYRHAWVFEDTTEVRRLIDRACFASLLDIPKDAKYITVWTKLTAEGCEPDPNKDDYSPAMLDTSRFTKLVNYWIHIGKLLGLKFDNIKWDIDRKKRILRFVLDIRYLQKFKGNKYRMLWMHLFFLRLLTERSTTIVMLRMYRKRLMKRFPYLSLLTTVIMCERHRMELTSLYSFKRTWYDPDMRPAKKCSISNAQYATGGHHFFNCMGNDRQLLACKVKSLYKAFMLEPNMPQFDTHLLRGICAGDVTNTLFQQAEKINAKAKAAGLRRYNIRKALPVSPVGEQGNKA